MHAKTFTFNWRSSCQCACALACGVCVAKQQDEKGKCDVIGTCGRQKELNFQYSGWMQPISAGLLCVMALLPLGAQFCRKQPCWSFLAFTSSRFLETCTEAHSCTYKDTHACTTKVVVLVCSEKWQISSLTLSLVCRLIDAAGLLDKSAYDWCDWCVYIAVQSFWGTYSMFKCVWINPTSYKIRLCYQFDTYCKWWCLGERLQIQEVCDLHMFSVMFQVKIVAKRVLMLEFVR